MTCPHGFSVIRRNYGHWDISGKGRRLFRIRGGPGRWIVFDEREPTSRIESLPPFKEQSVAMSFICAELMHELLTVEGQAPYVMEGWNVR